MNSIKIIQAGIDRNADREVKSMEQLKSLGLRYIRIENEPYDREPPVNEIFRGWTHLYKPGDKHHTELGLNSRHYGAWLSHKQSIMLGFSDKGHSLICEADCKILDLDKFKERLEEASKILDETDYPIVRFEKPNSGGIQTQFYNQVSENIFECNEQIMGHCYLINEKSKNLFEKLYEDWE